MHSQAFLVKHDPELTHRSHVHYATGKEKLRAHAGMVLFSLLVAGSFSVGGMIAREMDPLVASLLRFIITTAVLAGITIVMFRQPLGRPTRPHRFIVTGLLLAFYIITMFIALQYTSPVSAGAVFTLMPLMSAGFAYVLMGQKTRPGVLLSLLVAAAGAVWVVFRGDVDAILSFDVGRGEILYFFGVLAHAVYAPLLRRYQGDDHPVAFGFWVNAAATAFIFLATIPALSSVGLAEVTLKMWLLLTYIAVMATTLTFLLMQYALLRLPSSKVVGYGYLAPTTVIIMEGLLGHGWASLTVMVGALITACALIIMALMPD